MRKLIVNQPAGLGDIIWIQPIIEHFVQSGFQVIHPVIETYYEVVSRYLPRNGVTYVLENSVYKFKEYFNSPQILQHNGDLYLPLHFSHLHFPQCPLMISKYLLAQVPLRDFRQSIPKIRDKERENSLEKLVNPNNEDFVLISQLFGTPPNSTQRTLVVNVENGLQKIYVDYQNKALMNFHLFDWVGLIEKASGIHLVESALSFLVDVYASDSAELHMYDRVGDGAPARYMKNFEFVHRHPAWVYHI
jgi:hypothetical protein